ncbi:MAG: hypothetical protein HY833_02940 [Candidatus Aenigmarchaeota archaeon]|nr:hypothetical protein [Candidatus Aenigmarchaeota archaeon]
MSSLVDLVIATGLFFVFTALILTFVLTYYTNFVSVLEDSELRTSAANVNNVFFGGEGVPSDWELRSGAPVRIGLMTDLNRAPIIVATKNSSDFNNFTVNFTVSFDPSCLNTTRENTIRVFNDTNAEHPYTLYNKTYCVSGDYLKSADFAMNVSLVALRPTRFSVYYSSEPGVNATSYGTIPYPRYTNWTSNMTNFTVVKYPVEGLKMVSMTKVRALRNLTYSQVAQTLGSNTRFQLEVDVP